MKIDQDLKKRIEKAVSERIEITTYDPCWPKLFDNEAKFLRYNFPSIIKKIEHFGSTAVPGLSAKPIVDMLIEVSSFKDVKKIVVPRLTDLGYDYFWRPEIDKPPYYTWFIKRDNRGNRTHHLHMVRADSKLWDRLYFRDYLRQHPKELELYDKLKCDLSKKYIFDRVAYTKAKTAFITSLTRKAKQYYVK
jgi:GrpB-like predicted nucleotidyltransferase (UPF0157 family)